MTLDTVVFGNTTILEIFVKLIIIFLVTPVHEYAHAFAAHKLGDDTAAYQGRLTLNPIAHIDIIGAICIFLCGFGWAKPVPVNPLKFDKKHTIRGGMALTALAGPLSNLIVAYIGLVGFRFVLYFANPESDIAYYLSTMLYYFSSLNVGLAIFNFIPIPPLDGSKILCAFLPAKFDHWLAKNERVVSIVFMVVVVTGILSFPIGILSNFVMIGLNYLAMWVDLIAMAVGVI
ncbi:MAG: site-2 protease family protein [Oscillospiraceae bacterium]|nr:site-2 protease family protein [Oscillospiraceae bacterium]